MNRIKENRMAINDIDKKIAVLFEQRMNFVSDIAKEKVDRDKNVYDPEREKKVIENVLSVIKNPSLKKYVIEIFKDMMEVSKRFQQDIIPGKENHIKLKISKECKTGYQGTEGSYTEQAYKWFFGENTDPLSYNRLEELFSAISTGEIESGVVPYENSSTGGVNAVTDMLRNYNLYIKAETEIRIEHCLLGIKGAVLKDIKYAYSHSQGLSQCSCFFTDNKDIIECSYANTAFAARDVAKWGDKKKGAVASKRCAALYGLDIIRENIQNNSRNKTRFIVISANSKAVDNATKTSILFTSNHTPGALYKVLEPFYENEINITRIESRPNPRRSFEYFFYLDFIGSTSDAAIVNVLEKAKQACGYFRILGSYSSL